ncbi:hypothetical protein CERSUDRAFT_111470 [Gelatoporia subvermispora B]|uniref:BTB domain-containing protein n=1 Tax=Ceriporiopsis subvermispora (strain B) TaxID=914234 RepID=M2PVU1_CERS8|nr:hypothetical protein CERSUDRAFT_111470 [Gelatoporia subvermispora B]
MENAEWESVLQFVSEPLDLPSPMEEKLVSERAAMPSNPASQIPTPPASDQGSPILDQPENNTIVSVSTTFYPGANHNPLPPDLILLSSDGVFFYVHTHQILGSSDNGFNGLLPAKPSKLKDDLGPVVPLDEPAAVVNVMLHTIYNLSCAHYSPAVDTLIAGVNALAKYGVSPKAYIVPSTPLYSLILSQAPIAPIELYALAGKYDIYELAVPISSHLLAFSLPSLTDELSECMGPVYLRRLFFLHLGRIDALKRLLLPPPHPHPATPTCDFTEQKKLTRAWALASAYLAWDARPDLSTSAMESALCPLAEHLSCEVCQNSLNERIKQLIIQWSVVKRTI